MFLDIKKFSSDKLCLASCPFISFPSNTLSSRRECFMDLYRVSFFPISFVKFSEFFALAKLWNRGIFPMLFDGGREGIAFRVSSLNEKSKVEVAKPFIPFQSFPIHPFDSNLGRFDEIKKSRTRKQLSELVWRPHNTIPGWLFSLTSFRVFVSCLML